MEELDMESNTPVINVIDTTCPSKIPDRKSEKSSRPINQLPVEILTNSQLEGFGVVTVQLIPDQPPLSLDPDYYCPHAKTGILLPQFLRIYNKCEEPTHKLFKYLSIICPHQQKVIKLPTTQHNNLDFMSLSIMHFSNDMVQTPTVATLYT